MFNDYQFTIAIETISQVFIVAIFIAGLLFHLAWWLSLPPRLDGTDREKEEGIEAKEGPP